jgi:hypothetical protein
VGDSRYVQYRVVLIRAASGQAPSLTAIGITHNGELPTSSREVGGFPG